MATSSKYKKKSNWKKFLEYSVFSILGGIVGAVGINVAQKPSSQEIRASQSKSTMTVTAYSAEEFNAKTALGTKIRPGLDAAVSRDRLDLLGKQVYISCDDFSVGIRNVTDLTNSRIENTVDILVPTTKAAEDFGRCTECEIIELGRIKQ